MLNAVHEVTLKAVPQLSLVATEPTAPVRYLSPLRYPGAKAKLTPLIALMIERAIAAGRLQRPLTLVEPFAGGAATSLRLLTDGVVDHAIIADADPLVASFWIEAATNPTSLIEAMTDEVSRYVVAGGQRAVDRWDYWHNWDPSPGEDPSTIQRLRAMKCLFLNRTTFSGILHGNAGPIGGRAQTSDYKIGCRFNAKALAARINWVAHLHNIGRLATPKLARWQDSMNEAADQFEPSHTIAYLDPPYVEKSARLYKTGFSKRFENPDRWEGLNEHEELAAHLRTTATIRWILSYDDHPELLSSETLYANALTTADARTLIQVRPANDIVLRRIELQHSASSQKKRHQVPELVLTTLAESDCEGVGEPIWAQRPASSSTPD